MVTRNPIRKRFCSHQQQRKECKNIIGHVSSSFPLNRPLGKGQHSEREDVVAKQISVYA